MDKAGFQTSEVDFSLDAEIIVARHKERYNIDYRDLAISLISSDFNNGRLAAVL